MRRARFSTAFFILFTLSGLLPLLFPEASKACSSGSPLPGTSGRLAFLIEESARLPDSATFEDVLLALSAAEGPALTGRPFEETFARGEIGRLAGLVLRKAGGRKDSRRILAAMNRVIFDDEGFSYERTPGGPEGYLLDRVLAGRRGNCLGLSLLYLVLAERLELPLKGVHAPSHCFVRYEAPEGRLNIETADGGAAWEDGRYARLFRISGGRPYLRSLDREEMIGIFLLNVGVSHAGMSADGQAFRLYRMAARFCPELPEASFNLGVLYQRKGLVDQAAEEYRRALSLDPGLSAARSNLAAALGAKGLYVEALAEARRAVDLDPDNVVARGNLALGFLSCGMIDEGIAEWKKVLEIDPGNARALEGLARAVAPPGSPGS